MKTKSLISLLGLFTFIFSMCESQSSSAGDKNSLKLQSENEEKIAAIPTIVNQSPDSNSKVIFFIENSGSMRGYVDGSTHYVDVLANIANHPRFITDSINKTFYLTSGISSPSRVTNLRQSLIPSNFNQPRSDLNNLFKTALDSTVNNTISILISDGIYDMCPDPNPLSTLSILSYALRSIFINKLQNSDFQTIVVKLKSGFNGRYYPGNCGPAYNVNQERPYYIWIFGDSKDLQDYFPDEYLEQLSGYDNSARYFKFNPRLDNYRPNAHKIIGKFKQSATNAHELERAKAQAGTFQFSIAVDFSDFPLNDNYLRKIENYSCTSGFEIISVDEPTPVSKLNFPEQTHLIVLRKTGNPSGILTVSLLNKGYSWISETNMANDTNVAGNTSQTFGFEMLNRGILEAYKEFSPSEEIDKFTITFK